MTDAATATPVLEEETTVVLTLNDRCDADCSAAAQAVAKLDSGSGLMFCGHHLKKFEESLVSSGFKILARAEEELEVPTPEPVG